MAGFKCRIITKSGSYIDQLRRAAANTSRTGCDSHLRADSTRFEHLRKTMLIIQVSNLVKNASMTHNINMRKKPDLTQIILKVVSKDLNVVEEEDHKEIDRQKLEKSLVLTQERM